MSRLAFLIKCPTVLVPGLNKILWDFYFGYKKRLQKDVMPGLVGKLQRQNDNIKTGEKFFFTKHIAIQ